jgi:hypothetical protein
MIESIVDKITNPIYLFLLGVWGITIFSLKGAIMEKIKSLKFSDLKDITKLFKLNKFRYSIKDLEYHDVFIILDQRKTEYKPNFKTYSKPDETKNKVFIDFVNLKMDSTIKNMKRVVTEYKPDFNEAQLKAHIYECFKDCNECLAKEIIKFYHKKKKIDKEIVLKLSNDFFDIRQNALVNYSESFERVFASPFYENNFQRINAIFETVSFESKMIVQDIQKAFDKVNGVFMDIDYE